MQVRFLKTGDVEATDGLYTIEAGTIHRIEKIVYDFDRQYGDIYFLPEGNSRRVIHGLASDSFEPMGDAIEVAPTPPPTETSLEA